MLQSEGTILYSHTLTVFLPLYILVFLKTYILFLAGILEIKVIFNVVLCQGRILNSFINNELACQSSWIFLCLLVNSYQVQICYHAKTFSHNQSLSLKSLQFNFAYRGRV